MRIYHKAYKKEVTVSALADARQVTDASAETIAETDKLIKGIKSLTYAGHKGIDAWHNWGSQIYATHSGIVSWSRDEGDVGGGCWLEITRTGLYSAKHSGQDAEQYKHLRRGSVVVKQGQRVVEGQLLGIQGSTGNSTGEHLHYEVYRHGRLVDPLPYAMGTETQKDEEIEVKKLSPYNLNDAKAVMVTCGAYATEAKATEVLARVQMVYPEAGLRKEQAAVTRHQVVAGRHIGTVAEAKIIAEDLQLLTGIASEAWTW